MAYVIIGNSAAGLFAAEAIRQHDREQPLIIISDEPYPAYSRCLTSYYIGGQVTEQQMYLRPHDFYQRLGIDLQLNQKVIGVDLDKKQVVTQKGDAFSYTKLLVASGASPQMPNIPGIDSRGVFGLRTLDDAKAIAARATKGKQAVVLGGGLVSLKAAYALCRRGVDVTVVVTSNQVMSQVLDATAAAMVEQKLTELGIKFLKGMAVSAIEADGSNQVSGVQLACGDKLPARLVLVGKGVRPNTGFLTESGLVKHAGDPLQVNRQQATSVSDVYAAGDVALSYDLAREEYRLNAIWPNATEQGMVAGANMAGATKEYPGSISMNSAVFADLSVIAAGITRPQENDYRVLTDGNPQKGYYRKLVLADDRLVGYILAGDTSRAGLYTGLIKKRHSIKNLSELLQEKPRSWISLAGLVGTNRDNSLLHLIKFGDGT
ncbi:NAD(P)/FAD-dependent oxidoreductase [Calderihabitans maritimus]|uniref:Nitrite reductase n=1 Tax=Calderihabitans maritimus TaxID=1246530 RepID=A0A1Z5HS02_9FIRM|nr:FAD-dependent oxidoreductase [Calderihabitans maritimus]GAW92302.1 nitrite reductase [Calderihabitans maritimus]